MLLVTTTKGLEALERTGQIDTNEGWRAAPMAWEDLREELEGAAVDFDAAFIISAAEGADGIPADEQGAYDEVIAIVLTHDVVPVDGIDEVESIYPEDDVVWVRGDAGWVRYAGA